MHPIFSFADNSDTGSFASQFRRRRMQRFVELIHRIPEPVSILDVGGTFGFWRNHFDLLDRRCDFTILNLFPHPPADHPENFRLVMGDACHMPEFENESFDACFSNSVIEHVGRRDKQRLMAAEIRRIARCHFVQTPNRNFPIEPHFLFPFWQFLPTTVRVAILTRFDVGWMERQPDPILARSEIEQIQLLTRSEMQEFFPGAEIVPEQFMGMTKSWTAISSP